MKKLIIILFLFPLVANCQLNSTSSKQVDTKITTAIKPVQASIANVATSVSSVTSKNVSQDKSIASQLVLINGLKDSIRRLNDSIKVLIKVVGSDFDFDVNKRLRISQSGMDRIKAEVKKP